MFRLESLLRGNCNRDAVDYPAHDTSFNIARPFQISNKVIRELRLIMY